MPPAKQPRVLDEPAFVLHRHDWSESSLILEVFSRQHGRVVLAAIVNGRVSLIANFSDQVVEGGARAGDLIKEIAPIVGGKGGGRPTMARGGGNDADKVEEALKLARRWLKEKLG
jgi:alanyl-tRNA synthetase